MKNFIKTVVVFVIICAILIIVHTVTEYRKEKISLRQYSETVTKYSFQYNTDANFIMAVILTRMRFHQRAL